MIETLQEVGRTTVDDFAKDWRSVSPDKSWWFHDRARQLETEVLSAYRTTVLATKRMGPLEDIEKAWGSMVATCARAAQELDALIAEHPDCSAEVYRDSLINLGQRCQRLQTLHS